MKDQPVRTFTTENGLVYRCDLRSYTENYVPWTGEYEGKTMDKILKIVPRDQNVLDIGANVGYWSINLAKLLDRDGKVYAFEMMDGNYHRILDHVNLNHMEDSIVSFHTGLGDVSKKVTFTMNSSDKKAGAETFNSAIDESDEGDVTIRTLDSIVNDQQIDNIGFIKIDVEGYEFKVFEGGMETLSKHRPIIYGEFTPELVKKYGGDPQKIYSILDNYSIYQEGTDGFNLIENQPYHRDLLMIPNEKKESVLNKLQ